MKFGLMIVDLQKAFYDGYAKESMDSAVRTINEVLPSFRKTGCPVLWIQHLGKGDGILPGTEGFELIDGLKPETGDYHIYKEYQNSFNKTESTRILRENDVDIVVVAGYCAEYCVISTYKGALDYDFFPVILKDGIASWKKGNEELIESITNVISPAVLKKIMEKM
ncbi:MAG: isochorismatase family protein [Halanaerobiaceae bacterium]|jgi:nicotinamidase-related amidase|nr:isochorismatase family protein [Halanaerobiaceae bacterium]